MEENNKVHYDLYVMAESKYKKSHEDLDDDELFPDNWYSGDNYYLKNKILAEAMMNNCLIKETEKYQEFLEKVVRR